MQILSREMASNFGEDTMINPTSDDIGRQIVIVVGNCSYVAGIITALPPDGSICCDTLGIGQSMLAQRIDCCWLDAFPDLLDLAESVVGRFPNVYTDAKNALEKAHR